MPLYDFRCSAGHVFEKSVPLADFEVQQFCHCLSPADRIISAPLFSVENVYYDCPITGKPILSKRAHEDNLNRHDCRVLETGEKEANDRFREEQNKELDRKVDTTVERFWDTAPSDVRENLAKDLISGADTTVERK